MRCKIHGAVHADELSRPRIAGTLVWVMFQICTLPSLFPRPGYCLHGTGHCTAWHWLMTAHWAGAARRLSESDASWVRSVFVDGEVSLIDLLKCHDENLAFQYMCTHASLRIMLCSSEGQMGGRNLDILQGWKKSNCWAWTANAAWKGSSV